MGKYLLDQTMAMLAQTERRDFTVECAPRTSEKFWRRHGFVDYPLGHPALKGNNPCLYRILQHTGTVTRQEGCDARLEIWNKSIHSVAETDLPIEHWDLHVTDGGLIAAPLAVPHIASGRRDCRQRTGEREKAESRIYFRSKDMSAGSCYWISFDMNEG